MVWCRVPEECPQEIADLIQQCKLVEPKQRPSAKEVFEIIRKNCIAKRYNGSIIMSYCHEQVAVRACKSAGPRCWMHQFGVLTLLQHKSVPSLTAAVHGALVCFGELSASFV